MFTIECYTNRYFVDPVTREMFLSDESAEEVGTICYTDEDGVHVGTENTIVFNTGYEAIIAITDLSEDGEDLLYVCRPYRTSNP